MRPFYYGMNGEPITREQWVKDIENSEYKRVDKTELAGGGFVSTIWLGLDHSFGNGPPLIFESMDFPGQTHQRRYSTLLEAAHGHEQLVAELDETGSHSSDTFQGDVVN